MDLEHTGRSSVAFRVQSQSVGVGSSSPWPRKRTRQPRARARLPPPRPSGERWGVTPIASARAGVEGRLDCAHGRLSRGAIKPRDGDDRNAAAETLRFFGITCRLMRPPPHPIASPLPSFCAPASWPHRRSEARPATVTNADRLARSPRSIAEFLSMPNATDIGFSFPTCINISAAAAPPNEKKKL
jgi:hypothetical protein